MATRDLSRPSKNDACDRCGAPATRWYKDTSWAICNSNDCWQKCKDIMDQAMEEYQKELEEESRYG